VNIKPYDVSTRALLESGYYRIPRFQRPYSWDLENVNDFWEDTVVADSEDYFIGAFVVYSEYGQDDLHYIVDGQQRLTTITLLLAALRDTLKELEQDSFAQGVHKLIERPDINNRNQFVLQSDTPYPYLQECIQKLGPPDVVPEIGNEERALQRAYEFLRKKLDDRVRSVEIDPTIGDDTKAQAKTDAMVTIRDQILRLKLIMIELDNEDDAYLIFETLNTRGKNLTISDLLKNHFVRLLRPRTIGVDIARDKWLGIQDRFDKASTDININSFILHSWLSRHPYTSQKKLFQEIKKVVVAENAAGYLDDFVTDSQLYQQLLDPSSSPWAREDRPVRDAVLALNLFRVAQPLPMMLALLRAYQTGVIKRRQAKLTFTVMENFHAQFTAVTSQRTGGGTAQMYASSARQLVEASDRDARARVLRDFVDKLRQRIPPYGEFEANLREVYFASTQTKQRSLVRYLLRRFDEHWRAGQTPADYDQLTIEHIAPESHDTGWSVSDEKVGMIGNLILVTEDLNNRLGDRPFREKLAILKQAAVPMDEYLAQASSWGDAEIEARTELLAKTAYDDVFRL
jgi:hypothetical protein